MAIRGVYYDMDTASYPAYRLDPRHKIGFLAEEVEAQFPELIKKTKLHTPNQNRTNKEPLQTMDIKTVNYMGLIPVLVEAIKEQQRMIDELTAKVEQSSASDMEALKKRLDEQQKLIEQLQRELKNHR